MAIMSSILFVFSSVSNLKNREKIRFFVPFYSDSGYFIFFSFTQYIFFLAFSYFVFFSKIAVSSVSLKIVTKTVFLICCCSNFISPPEFPPSSKHHFHLGTHAHYYTPSKLNTTEIYSVLTSYKHNSQFIFKFRNFTILLRFLVFT